MFMCVCIYIHILYYVIILYTQLNKKRQEAMNLMESKSRWNMGGAGKGK